MQDFFSEMYMGNPMDYKEDKSHNSAAKLWYVRNASLKNYRFNLIQIYERKNDELQRKTH